MPEFIIRRLNASWMDLKPEQVEPFRMIRDYAITMGKGRLLTEGIIVNLIYEHGVEMTDILVKRFCGRGFFSLDRLQGLIDGSDTMTFEKPSQTTQMNEMPGRARQRESNQTKTVGAFLDQAKAVPGEELTIPQPERAMSIKKLPEGWFTKSMMEKWMADNRPHELHLVDEFFHFEGINQVLGPLWKLIVRVSE